MPLSCLPARYEVTEGRLLAQHCMKTQKGDTASLALLSLPPLKLPHYKNCSSYQTLQCNE